MSTKRYKMSSILRSCPRIVIMSIETLLNNLSDISIDELTTFELDFLRRFADKPPTKSHGAEMSIPMTRD